MRDLINLVESTQLVTLYHGTCASSADALCKNGWSPNSGSQGGNMGQSRYLYLSTGYEDAQWFANEKGCDSVLKVTVPKSFLIVDPEDGSTDTLDAELNMGSLPGKVALTQAIGPESFEKISLSESWDDEDEDEDDEDTWFDDDKDDGPDIETTGYKFGKIRDFYRQVKQVAEMHMGSGSDIEFDDVENWVEHHRELFEPGTITVYRTMMLNPSFIEKLHPDVELGQHWTYEFDADVLDGFDINGSYEHANKGEAELFVFEGEIDTRDANLVLTVAYNCLFPHEKEIFLTGGVTIKSITEFDFSEGHKEKVRPDLTGKRFGV